MKWNTKCLVSCLPAILSQVLVCFHSINSVKNVSQIQSDFDGGLP